MRLSHLLSAAAAVAISVGVCSQAFAGGAASPLDKLGIRPAQQVAPPPGGKTVLVTGVSGATATAGNFTNVDPGSTITCGNKGCSISAHMLVQLQSATGTQYAVCLLVDGTNYAPCPFAGQTNNTNFYTVDELAFLTALAPGNHTVQTQVYVGSSGTVIYNYYMRYDVLK